MIVMQDPNPLPWGAQDRFQAHFIVKQDPDSDPSLCTARTILSTSGHFGSKKITKVEWNGGRLADELNGDIALNDMISKQSVDDATIFVDPVDGNVRIYGKWKNHFDFGITKEMFEIIDRIAGHVKIVSRSPPIEC